MNDLVARVTAFVRRHALFRPGESTLVGVSGGPDSVCLSLILQEISSSGALPLRIRLAHLNHCLRGAEADADEEFCRRFAAERGVELAVGRVRVQEEARRGESLEQAARRVRYRFLAQAARDAGIGTIAVGHHADDAAETVAMRLLRGCGLWGLAAMAPARPVEATAPTTRIVRPLLETGKAELLDFLSDRGQPFRLDSSNLGRGFLRNRIRHDLLPALQRNCPGFTPATLCTLNKLALDVNALLNALLDARWTDLCAYCDATAVGLDMERYRDLPAALRKLAVRRALGLLHSESDGRPGLTRREYNSIADLTGRPVGDALCLSGGFTARREHGLIHISRPAPAGGIPETNLPVPGSVCIGQPPLRITAEVISNPPAGPALRQRRADEAFLSLDALRLPLKVRSRRPGDRLRPLGAPGHRKLKDFFIDRKVPRHERDRTPLVVDAAGQIVWVVGHEIGEPFKLLGAEVAVLHLAVERLAATPRP